MRGSLLVAALFLVAVGAPEAPRADGADAPTPPRTVPTRTVVVELFTSQGCSSCPPADRLLGRLAGAPMVDGVEVIPLAFHVDYWNHIGWQDPFSSEEWSERQRAYATAFGLDTIYTPQLFLNGRRQMVGASERQLRREIRAVSQVPATVGLSLAVDVRTAASGDVRVHATAAPLANQPTKRLFAMLAVFQDGLVTPVASGENARKTLENERVVRGLYPLFEIGEEAGRKGEKVLDLALHPDWPRDDLGLVLFVQDPASLEIHGAETVRLRDSGPTRL